jgi:hypothetical protein
MPFAFDRGVHSVQTHIPATLKETFNQLCAGFYIQQAECNESSASKGIRLPRFWRWACPIPLIAHSSPKYTNCCSTSRSRKCWLSSQKVEIGVSSITHILGLQDVYACHITFNSLAEVCSVRVPSSIRGMFFLIYTDIG